MQANAEGSELGIAEVASAVDEYRWAISTSKVQTAPRVKVGLD